MAAWRRGDKFERFIHTPGQATSAPPVASEPSSRRTRSIPRRIIVAVVLFALAAVVVLAGSHLGRLSLDKLRPKDRADTGSAVSNDGPDGQTAGETGSTHPEYVGYWRNVRAPYGIVYIMCDPGSAYGVAYDRLTTPIRFGQYPGYTWKWGAAELGTTLPMAHIPGDTVALAQNGRLTIALPHDPPLVFDRGGPEDEMQIEMIVTGGVSTLRLAVLAYAREHGGHYPPRAAVAQHTAFARRYVEAPERGLFWPLNGRMWGDVDAPENDVAMRQGSGVGDFTYTVGRDGFELIGHLGTSDRDVVATETMPAELWPQATTHDPAEAMRSALATIRRAVVGYARANEGKLPRLDDVVPGRVGRYLGSWPKNPYTGRPMIAAYEPGVGDFEYRLTWSDDGVQSFELTGTLDDGSTVVVAGPEVSP
jgi:hypothetical protein